MKIGAFLFVDFRLFREYSHKITVKMLFRIKIFHYHLNFKILWCFRDTISRLVFFCLSLMLLMYMELFGQSNVQLVGSVIDSTAGNPLYGASIQLNRTSFTYFTDEDGFFTIENVNPGVYEATINRLGYREKHLKNIVIHADQPSRLEIFLCPLAIQGDSVFIYAKDPKKQSNLIENKTVLSSIDIQKFEKLGISHLLQQIPGIQIVSSGGTGGVTRISIHGSKPTEVLVLLDGQQLNNPQTGEVDLNVIPMEQIERIEIFSQGNSARFGAGAFAGVVAFYTKRIDRQNNIKIASRIGSFSTVDGNISISKNFEHIRFLVNYFQDYSRQNFNYFYEGGQKNRENNWYRDRRFFGKLQFDLDRHQFIITHNIKRGNRGLPSAYFDEYIPFNAFIKEDLRATQFQYQWFLLSKIYLNTQVAYHQLSQLYNNEDAPLKQQYKTVQKNNTLSVKTLIKAQPNRYLEYNIGSSYLKESLDQSNLLHPSFSIGGKSRKSYAIFGNMEFNLPDFTAIFQSTQFRSALRYQKIFGDLSDWYPYFGMSTKLSGLKQLTFAINWGKSVRYPDFNSLFWKGDARAQGNPDLKPECKTNWHYNIRYVAAKRFLPRLSLHYFFENIHNLIFWHRSYDGIWEPRNEAMIEKRGWDLQIDQYIVPDHFQIQTGYSRVDAINKKDDPVLYDKKMVFIPEHTLNSLLTMNLNGWQWQIIYRYVSERETVLANSKGTQIPSYKIWDTMIGYDKVFGKVDLQIGFIIKNIFEENYQLIFGYPMPGREYQLTISIDMKS